MTAALPLTRPAVADAPVVSPLSGPLAIGTLTIGNGASLSAAVDLEDRRLVRIAMPAAWDAAVLTFQTSPDDATYNNLYDSLGNEYTVQAAASRAIIIPFADFLGVRFLKVRSGTAGVPVNQTADRVLTLVAAP